jgi:hypothetical protein
MGDGRVGVTISRDFRRGRLEEWKFFIIFAGHVQHKPLRSGADSSNDRAIF